MNSLVIRNLRFLGSGLAVCCACPEEYSSNCLQLYVLCSQGLQGSRKLTRMRGECEKEDYRYHRERQCHEGFGYCSSEEKSAATALRSASLMAFDVFFFVSSTAGSSSLPLSSLIIISCVARSATALSTTLEETGCRLSQFS